MSLWFVMMMLCSAAAVAVSIPLIRQLDNVQPVARDQAIYEDQLLEVERDLKNGSISATEAELAKIEIQRRLASTQKNMIEARPLSPGLRNAALAGTAGLIIVGGISLYNVMGSPNLPSASNPASTAAAPQEKPAQSASQNVDQMVANLKARLQTNPQEVEGWRLLGMTQFSLKKYSESAEAYAKALALEPGNAGFKSAYGEAMVQSTEGIVTPKARTLFDEVLAQDPKDARGRYYVALAVEQSGDQTAALDQWLSLLADAPFDAGWRDVVRQHVVDLAKATGRDVTAALAAADGGQMNVINSMVESLALKLADNPKDLEGWLRLMRSYQVLKEPAKAKDAMAKALATFATEAASIDQIKSAAAELGIN